MKHGAARRRQWTAEYRVWTRMRSRCRCPGDTNFANYGGRGIRVCERWDSFEAFLSDMGPRPGPGFSIERNENDGHYEPQNCRWATRGEQMNNRRNTHWIEFGGKRMSKADWAREIGISWDALDSRLRSGWPLERALQP